MVMDEQGTLARVVVGVDGSERNVAAIDWAVAESRTRHVGLVLVGVAGLGATRAHVWSGGETLQYAEAETSALLERVAGRVRTQTPESVETVLRVGEPSREIKEATRATDLLVVGRRGIGLVEQVVLGSTSLELAGSSASPLVIVPDGWRVERGAGEPVVAGVDGTDRDDAVLEFAFDRAARASVPLVLVAASQLPAFYAWEQAEHDRWVKDAEERLTEQMGPWARRFPDVELACRAPLENAAVALLRAAEPAQIIVLGRYAAPQHVPGLPGLSTSRRVLHHATCPVAVVPVPGVDPDAFRFDETDAPQF